VLATGEAHSVREFIERAFGHIGRRIEWRGKGGDEVAIDTATGATVVRVDPRYVRPTEVASLLGDPAKAHKILGWHHRITFSELVREMMEADLAGIVREERQHGPE
jgi:GDPmannose 4,6-dehydratase